MIKDTYVGAELLVTEVGVGFEPIGDRSILPTAHIFENLRKIPMVQSYLFDNKNVWKYVEK